MRRALLTGLLLSMAPATAVYAQPTGTHIGPNPAEVRGDSMTDARRTLGNFGQCVVRSNRTRAERVLSLSANSEQYHRQLRQLATDDCLSGGQLRMSPLLMRGSIFEALLDVYHSDFQPTDLSQAPAIAYGALHTGTMTGPTRSILAWNIFADCVVRAAPGEARALLLVPPGGTREEEAVTALTPHFGPCVPSGANVAMSLSLVRAALAEVLYRYAVIREAAE